VAQQLETKFTENEFLESMDGLIGAADTLENRTDRYVDTLNRYMNDETSDHMLENSIEDITGSLEILYDALDSMDDLIEEESMVAYVEDEDGKHKLDLDKLFSQMTHGISSNINNFDDIITVSNHLDEIDIEADRKYLQPQSETGAPTRIVAEKNQILEIDARINDLYEKIASNEVLARQNTESSKPRKTYSPEPPIFRMLGHEEYADHVNRLNKKFKKNK